MQLFREKDEAQGATFSLWYSHISETCNWCSTTGESQVMQAKFPSKPEKPRGKFSQPKHFLFMFKPLKKSLHYVLVFPSLLAIFLTTHHPRMGKVMDPSVLLPRHSLPAALRGGHQWGETGIPQCFSQSAATPTNTNLSTGIIYPMFSQKMYLTQLLPSDEVSTDLAKEWLVVCILLIKSTPRRLHFICHATLDMHTVMKEFEIYTFPKLCIFNLNSNEI